MLKQVACLALLAVATSPALSGGNGPEPDQQLRPRMAKRALTQPVGVPSRLMVKFIDEVAVHATPDGALISASNADLAEIENLQAELGLTFSPVFDVPLEQIQRIKDKVLRNSGKEAWCMECLVYVNADDSVIPLAAERLLASPLVETGSYEIQQSTPAWSPEPAPNPGDEEGGLIFACCIDDGVTCNDLDQVDCNTAGGVWVVGNVCTDDPSGDGGNACWQACCLPDGTCDNRPVFQCQNIFSNGASQGYGVFCLTDFCNVGACCVPFADMVDCFNAEDFPANPLTQEFCEETLGGVYEGDFITCADLNGGLGCNNYGNCCTGGDCQPTTEPECLAIPGGIWEGLGTNCLDEDACAEPACGVDSTGSCFEEGGPFCDWEACCEEVCELDPNCCNEDNPLAWDAICVALAHQMCTGLLPPPDAPDPLGPDSCQGVYTGSCYYPSAPFNQGCNDADCCATVVGLNPLCALSWDTGCAALAFAFCAPPATGADTPDFTSLQGYLGLLGFAGSGADPSLLIDPPSMGILGSAFRGFNGVGLSLFDESGSDAFLGLYGLGEILEQTYGVGDAAYAQGLTIKIAVIDGSYHPGHEDLTGVRYESEFTGVDVTMFPELTDPDHGTAVLGVLAADNDDKGIVGIAPRADTWFFPNLSIEQGWREFTAMANVMDLLDAGDVVVIPYTHDGQSPITCLGPGDPENPEIHAATIQLMTDIGITTCVAAGNACSNLDDLTDNGDVGALVCGAVLPGTPVDRWPWSNFFQAALPTQSNYIHCSGWGQSIVTTGYGTLYLGDGDINRAYTHDFGGTSGATAMVGGVVACLQGLSKQFFSIPLSPEKIEIAVSAGLLGQAVDRGLGFDPAAGGCLPDMNPDVPLNNVQGMIRGFTSGVEVLSNEDVSFDSAPLVDAVYTLTGDYIMGNIFSVKDSDGIYYVVRSNHKNRPDSPDFTPNAPAGQAAYFSSGQVNDVMIEARNPAPNATTMELTVEYSSVGQDAIVMVEMYDFQKSRWGFLDIQVPVVDSAADTTVADIIVTNAQNYTDQITRDVLIRIHSYGIGGGQGFGDGGIGVTAEYFLRIDFVDLEVETPFGTGGGVFEG